MAIKLTEGVLREIFPRAHPVALASFLDEGQALLDRHGVSHTRNRLAHMFTHLHVESLGLTVFRENLNYHAAGLLKTFPRYFTTPAQAQAYERQPQKIANYVYGNRMGNGPASSGDGWRFAGKSATQITGKDGYAAITRFSGHDFVNSPDDAADPRYCCMIAVAFWSWKNVAAAADTGNIDNSCRVWNGGFNGLAERRREYPRILKILERAEGSPASATPPKAAIAAATSNEKRAVATGVVAATTGAAAKTSTTMEQPSQAVMPPKTGFEWSAVALFAAGAIVIAVAVALLVRKVNAVNENWK